MDACLHQIRGKDSIRIPTPGPMGNRWYTKYNHEQRFKTREVLVARRGNASHPRGKPLKLMWRYQRIRWRGIEINSVDYHPNPDKHLHLWIIYHVLPKAKSHTFNMITFVLSMLQPSAFSQSSQEHNVKDSFKAFK